jgi:hypothetical protein
MAKSNDDGSWLIRGKRLSFPMRVYDSSTALLVFTVAAEKARAALHGTGLRPVTVLGRAVLTLACVDYRESDLGTYHEVGVALLVSDPTRLTGPFILELPVTEGFTCEAGRAIWGLPKWIAGISMRFDGRSGHCRVLDSDTQRVVVEAEWRTGPIRIPVSSSSIVNGLSVIGGAIRAAPSVTRISGVRIRPGGQRPVVGRDHRMADKLRALGLPKRPLVTVVLDRVSIDLEAPFDPSAGTRAVGL